MKCICGRELVEKLENLTTRYKGQEFKIINVPTYSCKMDHFRFTIGTRRKISMLLKNAYENDIREADYNF